MSEKIDNKDRQVITELIRDSSQTSRQISKKTGIPITTVHNRVKKLRKIGVILNYTVNLNYRKMGRPLLAFIGVTVDYTKGEGQNEIAEHIKKLDGVQDVCILTGGVDIMVRMLAKDIDDLNNLVTIKLRKITGVDKTQTMIVLKEI